VRFEFPQITPGESRTEYRVMGARGVGEGTAVVLHCSEDAQRFAEKFGGVAEQRQIGTWTPIDGGNS
jgi:hypothetical protein